MNRLGLRRAAGGVLVLCALAAGGFAATGLAGGNARTTAASGALNMRFDLQRFQLDAKHHQLVAHGHVVASYKSGSTKATASRATTLTVKQGTTCKVLHLELGELRLSLLGLYVSLTPVDDPSIVLDISANGDEALGKLFCQVLNAVQNASITTATAKTTRLNSAMQRRSETGVMSLNTPLVAQATTPSGGQCPVLNVILGPLNLDLLGLVVQLNKVQLDVSANPTGTLGTLFCQLAGTGSTTSTGLTTTTAPVTTTAAK
jgi:hypothetical protein